MINRNVLIASLTFAAAALFAGDVHLFVLSGQSNMAGLRPAESFTPAVEKAFGKENIVVVHSAQGGQPIRRWHKGWKSATGEAPDKTGDLYDVLMSKVNPAINGKNLKSVTFLWMQGERDAKEKHGDVYQASLKAVIDQLKTDLKQKEINFVIGRLSDFDLEQKRYPHWNKVREAQVKLAESSPRGAWIDTDDLNDGKNRGGKTIKNDLHMSADGYVTMGQRFADAAIKLIQ